MTPAELKAWMGTWDFTERELAHELGVHWTLPYKWLTGEVAITPLHVRALQQLEGNTKSALRRRSLRWTTANLREWVAGNQYTVEDLGYALDLPDRGVRKLLDAADEEPVPRMTVLALRGLARERKVERPKGMNAEQFRRWLTTHRRSQREVADALGVSEGAVSRWYSVDDATHRGVSPMVRLALKTLERKR
jgi:DNA-binding transcriptional regulator YdaS (Cro superfamily)